MKVPCCRYGLLDDSSACCVRCTNYLLIVSYGSLLSSYSYCYRVIKLIRWLLEHKGGKNDLYPM